ncbi:MAG: type II toxin-antitoxin system Phd/YefM family antitoxin [Algicola sp.]|nr:type II toxin-antitoxin system Phd/YefM family antitoxin [Algicola sp.]
MTTLTATQARTNLYRVIDEVALSHQPVLITGKRNNAVLLSEEDWSAIQETLFLAAIPGMHESIKEGMDTDISQCSEAHDW